MVIVIHKGNSPHRGDSWHIGALALLFLATYSSLSHAYLQIERNNGWAVLVENEGKVYFQECGSSQLDTASFDLTPDALLLRCKNLSHLSPYEVSLANYRNWTSAHFGVATRSMEIEQKTSRVNLMARQGVIDKRAQREAYDSAAADLEILLEFEELIFRYLGSSESSTLRNSDSTFGLLQAVVLGFTPTYSNGDIVFQVRPPSRSENGDCPAYWAPASFETTSSPFQNRLERPFFLEWLRQASPYLGLQHIPRTWVAWKAWVERKRTSDGKEGSIPHQQMVILDVSSEPISSKETKDPSGLYGFCIRGRLPWHNSAYPKGPLSLNAVAERYGMSATQVFRWAMADDALRPLITLLIAPKTGITEETYSFVRTRFNKLMGRDLPNYFALATRNPDDEEKDKEAIFFHSSLGTYSKRGLTLCNHSSYPNVFVALALDWTGWPEFGRTTHFWFAIKQNKCIPLYLAGFAPSFYLYAYSPSENYGINKQWSGNVPLVVRFGSEAVPKKFHSAASGPPPFTIWENAGAVTFADQRRSEAWFFEDLIEQNNTSSLVSVNFAKRECPVDKPQCEFKFTDRGIEDGPLRK